LKSFNEICYIIANCYSLCATVDNLQTVFQENKGSMFALHLCLFYLPIC